MSITSSIGSSTRSEISSSVGWRPNSTASVRSASEILRARATLWTGRRTVRPGFATPHGAARIGKAAADRLADPERAVGRELEALAPVELLDRANQAEHALLDQVTERETLALVLAGHRDHEPQVRIDHAVLGLEVALLDALRQLDLLLGCEEGVLSILVEEKLQRVLQL